MQQQIDQAGLKVKGQKRMHLEQNKKYRELKVQDS